MTAVSIVTERGESWRLGAAKYCYKFLIAPTIQTGARAEDAHAGSGEQKGTSKGVEAMKSNVEAFLIGSILICAAAQDSHSIALTKGISVQMPVANHAVEMRAADEPNAKVVAVTADGKVFLGAKATEPGALSNLSDETVYLKADSRAPYQKVLTVLDALSGKSVVLLTAPPENALKHGIVPPYGVKLSVSR